MNLDPQGARLDEFDATEWRDVIRVLRPDLSDAETDTETEEFERARAEHYRLRALH